MHKSYNVEDLTLSSDYVRCGYALVMSVHVGDAQFKRGGFVPNFYQSMIFSGNDRRTTVASEPCELYEALDAFRNSLPAGCSLCVEPVYDRRQRRRLSNWELEDELIERAEERDRRYYE